ncbi:MAG: hypothetical protein GXY61_11515, partial [Lentisphaerae bacterium]|nr:hypothetical protein [Lentisphaerota bacterium]
MFKSIFFGLLLSASMLSAQTESIKLGVLDSGASVSFVQGDNGEWGIDIAGGPAPRIAQSQPV